MARQRGVGDATCQVALTIKQMLAAESSCDETYKTSDALGGANDG
ncbi:MAG: hypothetical protein V7641_5067 [Blastocatellia bacterium]